MQKMPPKSHIAIALSLNTRDRGRPLTINPGMRVGVNYIEPFDFGGGKWGSFKLPWMQFLKNALLIT